MANELILIDTSVMIDYYRKTDKANSVLIALLKKGHVFSISSITIYLLLRQIKNILKELTS